VHRCQRFLIKTPRLGAYPTPNSPFSGSGDGRAGRTVIWTTARPQRGPASTEGHPDFGRCGYCARSLSSPSAICFAVASRGKSKRMNRRGFSDFGSGPGDFSLGVSIRAPQVNKVKVAAVVPGGGGTDDEGGRRPLQPPHLVRLESAAAGFQLHQLHLNLVGVGGCNAREHSIHDTGARKSRRGIEQDGMPSVRFRPLEESLFGGERCFVSPIPRSSSGHPSFSSRGRGHTNTRPSQPSSGWTCSRVEALVECTDTRGGRTDKRSATQPKELRINRIACLLSAYHAGLAVKTLRRPSAPPAKSCPADGSFPEVRRTRVLTAALRREGESSRQSRRESTLRTPIMNSVSLFNSEVPSSPSSPSDANASGGSAADANPDHPLLKSLSLENLVNQREAILERLRAAIDLVREARTIAENAHLGLPRFGINHLSRHPTDLSEDDAFETARKQVDFGGWDYLMSESGL